MGAITIKYTKVDELIPYVRNARTHSPEQVARIVGSILEWGWTNPVLADEAGIVAGHGRVQAAREIYKQKKRIKLPNGDEVPAGCVPVIDVTGWDETRRRAYILADNQLATLAGWDSATLANEIGALELENFDIASIGFDEDELARLLGREKEDSITTLKEWSASDLEVKASFLFHAPIALQAKIRALLQREFGDIEFEEHVVRHGGD